MSERLQVVVTDYVESDLDWEAAEMAKRGIDWESYQLKQASEQEVLEKTRNADIVVVNMVKITRSLIAGWAKCKMVIRHGAGYDNVDVEALTERGIVLEYIPDYCQHEVAEHAIALIFACARKIVWGRGVLDDSVARGEWDFESILPMHRIDGSTIGIIGCGRIGGLVYKKLKHFGVKFLFCDPFLSEKRKQELGIETVDLETLCRNSDFVTVHTPLKEDTRNLVNDETLSWMKSSAYLINTSRGGMVDHDALADALKKKKIAGAAIDVFIKEPPSPDFPLLGLDNAIITPHLSWCSEEAQQAIREKIVEDIDRFAKGIEPRIPVNPEALNVVRDSR